MEGNKSGVQNKVEGKRTELTFDRGSICQWFEHVKLCKYIFVRLPLNSSYSKSTA